MLSLGLAGASVRDHKALYLAVSGGVSDGVTSLQIKEKRSNFSDSSNKVQMETHQREVLKKKTKLTTFLVNIQQT